MAVAVRRDLVARGRRSRAPAGKPLRDPAEHEERAAHAVLVEDAEQPLGVAHDAALDRRPTRSRGTTPSNDADVEVVLDVDGHRVDDRPSTARRQCASLRAPPQDHRLDRLDDDEQVERERQVLDVEEVVLQLLHRVLDAGAVGVAHLRPAGEPGLHDVALAVERNLLRSASATNSGRSGRGPTRLMSPRRTFQSCGSSSSRVRRRNRPTGVTRVSPLGRPHRAGARFSASCRIERNLWTREDAAVLADALLVIEHRAGRRQLDRRGHAAA